MSKYWQEDPNHKTEWGESGGLPIEPRTIHTIVENGRFISTDAHTVILGGSQDNIPINATERQKERETKPGFETFTNKLVAGMWDVDEWDEFYYWG